MLGRVADDRDDECAQEELGEADVMRGVLDRADEQLAHHPDEHAGDGQHQHRATQRPDRPRSLIVLGAKQVAVGAQREQQGREVERDHHHADRDRQMLELAAE